VITLTVVAFNDAPADGTLQVHLDEMGGTIGRADTNQLVLPDPERMVSRVAAQVVYRSGAFAIVDRGSNPIVLNGQPLASGREAPIKPGDRVRICGYELSVAAGLADPVASDDPFASLLGPAAVSPARGHAVLDPLLQPRAPSAPRAVAAAAAPPSGGIPMDWDPFGAAPPSNAQAARPAPRRDALGLDMGAASPEPLVPGLELPQAAPSSLDQLFGLGPASGGDPLADSMLEAPMAQPNMSADADPLRSLRSAPKASAASEADQLPDLNRPFIPPTVIKAAAPRPMPPSRPAPMPAPSPAPVRVRAPMQASAPVPVQVQVPVPVAVAVPAPMPAQVPVQAPVPVRAAVPVVAPVEPRPSVASSADSGALLDAFRRGLGAPSLELPALTPAVMEVIGQMLGEAVRGASASLAVRAPSKRGLRADAASVLRNSNNPLRFSPDAETALRHLLAPPARGTLAAAAAVREAFDEIRMQQFDVAAATQAALETALQRFEPAAIQSRLGERSALLSLLPLSRNARLWESFAAQYGEIRNDAIEEFRNAFGRAFMEALEAHLKRTRAAPPSVRPEATR